MIVLVALATLGTGMYGKVNQDHSEAAGSGLA